MKIIKIINNDIKKENELKNLKKYFNNSHIAETEIKQIYENNEQNFEKLLIYF